MNSFFEIVMYFFILKYIWPVSRDCMPPVNNIMYYWVHAEIAGNEGGNAGSRLAILFSLCFKKLYCVKKDKMERKTNLREQTQM